MTVAGSVMREPRGVGKGAAELLADLADARRAERLAASLLAEVREELAATVLRAKAKGVGYDRMAQTTLRAVRSRNKTISRRDREAARLRKLAQRHRVTGGHGFQPPTPGTSPGSSSPSMLKGERTMANPKLISRKTIEEHFVDSDEDKRLDDADDFEDENDADAADDESPRAARPRR